MILDGKIKKNMDVAVKIILEGGVVGFPTETVYGLGADALNPFAVEKIFKTKGRPYEDPLIVHIADGDQLNQVAEPLPPREQEMAQKLIEKFWPGPLTLIFKKRDIISPMVTGGLNTVAVRMPRHLVALALIKNTKRPLAAPSANKFQSISPTTAQAVEDELGREVLVLDGGPCRVGVESTVVSLVDGPRVLRLGGISVEDLEEVLGCKVETGPVNTETKLSPGMMEFHYAPRKPLKLFTVEELLDETGPRKNLKRYAKTVLLCFSKDEAKQFSQTGFQSISTLSPRGDLEEAARHLFAMLRELDHGPAERIYVLRCPDERLGRALNDRLKKAEHDD